MNALRTGSLALLGLLVGGLGWDAVVTRSAAQSLSMCPAWAR